MDLKSIKHQIDLAYEINVKNAHVLDEKDYLKQKTFVSFETLKWLIHTIERLEVENKASDELIDQKQNTINNLLDKIGELEEDCAYWKMKHRDLVTLDEDEE
jgi:hypothetical protein